MPEMSQKQQQIDDNNVPTALDMLLAPQPPPMVTTTPEIEAEESESDGDSDPTAFTDADAAEYLSVDDEDILGEEAGNNFADLFEVDLERDIMGDRPATKRKHKVTRLTAIYRPKRDTQPQVGGMR